MRRRISWTSPGRSADWWSMIGAIGTPDDALAYLESLAAVGVDAVAIFPNPDDPIGDARWLMDAVVARRG